MDFLKNQNLKFFWPAILILLGMLIYANSLHGDFHFDDYYFVRDNTAIRDITNIEAVTHARSVPARAVSFLTFALNYHFHGNDVFGYHVVNLAIHLMASLCVWWLIGLTFKTPRMVKEGISRHGFLIAGATAFLFLVHPIQTQAVSYISQRFASLAALFYLLSLCAYIKGRLTRHRLNSNRFFILSLMSALLGMFTKQTVLTLPLTIFLYEFFFLRGAGNAAPKMKGVYYTVLVLLLLIIPALYHFDALR